MPTPSTVEQRFEQRVTSRALADTLAALPPGLLQEARITGALEHPGIVPVHALGLDDCGLPLLVMKRIEGVSFRVLLDDPAHAAPRNVALCGAICREGFRHIVGTSRVR